MWGKKKKNLTRKSSDGVTTTKSGVMVAQFAQKSFVRRLKDGVMSLPGRIGRLPKNQRLAVLAGILVVLVLLAGLVWVAFFTRPDNSGTVCKDTDDNKILTEIKVVMDPNAPDRRSRLKETVEKIQSRHNYESDPNCLYPVVAYHLLIGDTNSARQSFDKLTKVSNGDPFYDAYDRPTTVDSLRTRVEHAEYTRQEAESSTRQFDLKAYQ